MDETQPYHKEAKFLPNPCCRQKSLLVLGSGQSVHPLHLGDHIGRLFAFSALHFWSPSAVYPLKGCIIYHIVNDGCLQLPAPLSVRIPFQSFMERYAILRKSCGSNRKRVCDQSSSHTAEETGMWVWITSLLSIHLSLINLMPPRLATITVPALGILPFSKHCPHVSQLEFWICPILRAGSFWKCRSFISSFSCAPLG